MEEGIDMSEQAGARPEALQARTLCEAFQLTAARWADRPALRAFGSDESWTWAQYAEAVLRRAAGLAALGVKRGDTVGFLLSNRPDFNLTDTAAMHLGATCWSLYATAAPEQLEHMLRNAESRIVVTEQALLERLLAVRGRAPELEQVVVVDGTVRDGLIPLEELEARGERGFDFEAAWRAVGPDDVLCLIYSSGTTGPSKGVELTHHNMLSQLRAFDAVYPITPGGRCISFLPSAHVADRWCTHYSSMVYGSTVHCLADTKKLFTYTAQVRPTVWGGVPRIWEKLKVALDGMLSGEADPQRRAVMRQAVETGLERVRARRAGAVPDELERRWREADERVFSRIRAMLGVNEVEAFAVGSAPTPPHILDFFAAIGIEIAEMWGLSECSSNAAINPPGALRPGTVGKPLPGVDLRLAPDGEILLRGPVVMKGYRKEPEKTAEAIDADGWLHTGDVGAVDADGYVRIIDRKKELIINSAGKNMSPIAIESAIKGESSLIGQAVAIGDARPYVAALIALDPEAAAGRAHDDPLVVREVSEAIERGNRRLARVEQVKRFHIVPEPWEPGGPCLTPTSKLKRKPIAERYAREIEALYAAEPV
jgi:long-subunit acyl-CoA synthetase (AMP-forming)